MTPFLYDIKVKAFDVDKWSNYSEPLWVLIYPKKETSGNVKWQKTYAEIDDTINADFEWWNAVLNEEYEFTALMQIRDPNDEPVEYEFTTTVSGQETLSCIANEKGEWKADLFVFYNIGNEDYIEYHDTITVGGNRPPDNPSNPSPSDGAVDVLLSPMLSVDVNDRDGDALTVSFYEQGGVLIGTDTVTGNGTASTIWTNANQHSNTYHWYAVADDTIDSTTSSTWSFTTIGIIPDKPRTPSGETSGDGYETYSYCTVSNDPNNLNLRYIFDWDDGTSDWTDWFESGREACFSHSWDTTSSETYYVKVKAENTNGIQSEWSDPLKVQITGNHPPTKPVIEGPRIVYGYVNYTYNISSTDSDNDLLYYKFCKYYNQDIEWEGPYKSGESYSVSQMWEIEGSHNIKKIPPSCSAYVKDEHGAENFDSLPIEVYCNYRPDKPSLNGPISGKPGVELGPFTAITSDQNNDMVYFMFDWGEGSQSKWLGPYYSNTACDLNHTWERIGDYSVKVKAKDMFGAESDWSDPLSITVPKNKTYLNKPILNLLEEYLNLFPIIQQLLLKLYTIINFF
jgi:hypothetical protein